MGVLGSSKADTFPGWQTPVGNVLKIIAITIFVLLFFGPDVGAQGYSIGLRGGASFERNPGCFKQVELFGSRDLPWLWGSNKGLNLKPRLEVSAGLVNDEDSQGFVGTAGPVLELRVRKFPVTLEGGVSLTAYSRYEFPDRDLGGWFQFTDHIGLDWRLAKKVTVGWRFQHTSNAGIYRQNPGINVQMLSFSYGF